MGLVGERRRETEKERERELEKEKGERNRCAKIVSYNEYELSVTGSPNLVDRESFSYFVTFPNVNSSLFKFIFQTSAGKRTPCTFDIDLLFNLDFDVIGDGYRSKMKVSTIS